MDYYQTLGVNKDASPEQLKKAYRKLAMENHPDRTGGDDTRFKQINEAYDTLKDPQKRQAYDNPQPDMNGFRYSTDGFDGGMPGGFEDIFQAFGFNPFQAQRQRQRADITIAVKINFEEAYRGKTLIGTYRLRTGREETVEIQIPKGAQHGNKIRYSGFGEQLPNGQRGDLYVQINVQPHSKYTINGLNINTVINVDIFDLITGGAVNLRTIDGSIIKLNIPPGTNPGTRLSVTGHGWPDVRTGSKGNMLVQINAVMPKNLGITEVDAIRKIKKRLAKKGID
jgi:curved DNA-binding protein